MDKLLSIIIPTYNMEMLLDQCLASLLIKENQNKLDVIVVNDGSQDKSLAIAHRFADQYPNVFRIIDKSNGNYGSCINAALPIIKGKYIKILDADDRYNTKNLNQFLSLLESLDVDLVLTDFTQHSPDGKSLGCHTFSFVQNKVFHFEEIPYKTFLPMHSVTYNRKLFSRIDYHQSEGISYTDMEWVFHPMSVVDSVYYCPLAIYEYLIGRDGQTMNFSVILTKQDDAAKGIFKEIDVIKSIDPNNKNFKFLDYWLQYRLNSIYRENILTRNKAFNLRQFDRQLYDKSMKYYKSTNDYYVVSKRFGIKLHLVQLWRNTSSTCFYRNWHYLLYKICNI